MVYVIYVAIFAFVIAGWWKAFEKAGQPGWAAIVPIYNVYILTKIAKKPGIWVLLMFIPIVGIVIIFLMSIEVARQFGKGSGFGIGLALLGFIFWPILGFGDAKYLDLPAAA
jgi:hypothetical protein